MEAIKTTLSRQMKDRSGQEWKGNLYIHKGQDEPEKIDEDVFSILTVH